MSNAFETAWQLVKMARHIISDDVEIWDPYESSWVMEGGYNDIPEGYEHLEPKKIEDMPDDYGWSNTIDYDTHFQDDEGNWKPTPVPKEDWRSWVLNGAKRGTGMEEQRSWFAPNEDVLPKGRDKPYTEEEMLAAHRDKWDSRREHHYPISYGQRPGDSQAKIMMTPKEFLGLVTNPPREDRNESSLDYMRGLIERNSERGGRTPLGMPNLNLAFADSWVEGVYPSGGVDPLRGAYNYKVTGHEGRHRMQTLVDLGLGDIPIPVLAALQDNQKHSFGIFDGYGRNKNWEANLPGSTIKPQGSTWSKHSDWRKVHPKEREWHKGRHPQARNFDVGAMGVWGKGKYDDLRRR